MGYQERHEVFHNRCLKGILGMTAQQQRAEHLSNVQIAKQCGMEECMEDLITARRLRWLGHVVQMDEERILKKLLFGWLPERRPAYRTKLRWRDRVRKDLRSFNIDEKMWYVTAQNRGN